MPTNSALSLRLTEPVLFLKGSIEYERARARRRQTANNSQRGASLTGRDGGFREASRSHSRSQSTARDPSAPGPSRDRDASPALNGASSGNGSHFSVGLPGSDFVSPSPARGRGRADSRASVLPIGAGDDLGTAIPPDRTDSPVPGRSASRGRRGPVTTGDLTREEQDELDEPPPAMLRGLLTLHLTKPTRIRSVTIKLRGLARTEWPEGIGPRRLDVMEENPLMAQNYVVFSAADAASERRASSLGPGMGERGQSRGRSSARRSASMMQTRETSAGVPLPSRDWQNHHVEPGRASSEASTSRYLLPNGNGDHPISVHSGYSSPGTVSPQTMSLPTSPEPRTRSLTLESEGDGRSPSPGLSRSGSGATTTTEASLRLYARSGLAESSPNYSSSSDPSPLSSTPSIEDRIGDVMGPPLVPLSRLAASPSPSRRSSGLEPVDEDTGIPTHNSSQSSLDNLPGGANGDSPARRQSQSSIQSTATMRRMSNTARRPSSLRDPSRQKSPHPNLADGQSPSRARFSLAGVGAVLRGKSKLRMTEAEGPSTSPDRARARSSSNTGQPMEREQSRGRKVTMKALRNALASSMDGGSNKKDIIDSDDEGDEIRGWKEFKAGTYSYPVTIPMSGALPPTIDADFGAVTYQLKATVVRVGALTSNLSASTEVCLVQAPSEEDTEEAESIVVERLWEVQLRYLIAISGKSFAIGGHVPISIRLNPLAKIKLFRLTVQLVQKTVYYASGRRITRNEPVKTFDLMRAEMHNPKEPMLPIFSEDMDIVARHPLASMFVNPESSDDATAQLFDQDGPWNLEADLLVPEDPKLCASTSHEKGNITISHQFKITMRLTRGDDEFLDSKGHRKQWDVIVESPVLLLSSHCAQNILPSYSPAAVPIAAPRGRGGFRMPTANGTTRREPSSSGAALTSAEDNLRFARLVAGQENPAGEVPPSYNFAVHERDTATVTSIAVSDDSSHGTSLEL